MANIVLTRSEKKNAFTDKTITDLTDLFELLHANQNIRGLILSSEGTHFSAGADLNWMKQTAKYTYKENKEDAYRLSHMLYLLYSSPFPTLCLCQGPALGGGLGLIASCDLSVVTQSSWFMFSEAKLGLIPATISPFIINRIGSIKAKRYFITCEKINSEKAQNIGLIDEIVPSESDLEQFKQKWIHMILNNSPESIRKGKELVNRISNSIITDENMNISVDMLTDIRQGKKAQEGISAFFEKRKPNWNI
ncbi:hypothetical protein WA158_003582 [Blastocystis sp. Blastoise]